MDDLITVFIFTDKAQKILERAQGNVFFDTAMNLAGLAFLLYAAFVVIRSKKNRALTGRIVGIAFVLFLFGSRFSDEMHHQQYVQNEISNLTTIYRNQEYQIVEGIVSVLHKEPESGHDSGDIIQVGGVEFELSCWSGTFGYNKTIVFGGVLTEGTFARIFYYQTAYQASRGRIILRIDILKEETIPFQKIDPHLPCAG